MYVSETLSLQNICNKHWPIRSLHLVHSQFQATILLSLKFLTFVLEPAILTLIWLHASHREFMGNPEITGFCQTGFRQKLFQMADLSFRHRPNGRQTMESLGKFCFV